MKKIILWIMLAQAAGCASAVFQHAPTLMDVQELIIQEKLGEAQRVLGTLEPQVVGPIAWSQTKADLENKIQAYETEIIASVDAYVAQKQWAEAKSVLHDGLHVLSKSERLIAKEREIGELQDQHRHALLRELYLSKAQTLIGNKKQLNELKKFHMNDQQSQDVMRESRQQVEGLKESLIDLAKYYIGQGRFEHAEQCLNLAQKLDGDASIQSVMSDLKRQRKVQKIASKTKEKTDAIRQVEWSIDQGSLEEAKSRLGRLEEKFPNDLQVKSIKNRLEIRINQRVEAGLEAGRIEYQQRNIQRALSIWEPLLELAPKHKELNRNIQRANQILEKLERISSESDGG